MPSSAQARPAAHDLRPLAVALLAGLTVLVLLWAIGLVMRQAVRQGDAGRRAMALQAEADWRCRALQPRTVRERCLALVRERKPWDSAGVQALVLEAGSARSRP
jgi:hypothetical protein